MTPSAAYEAIPYDDRPVAESHPDLLWVAARRRGLELVSPTQMKVLELGCAHGVNLMPMAYHLPDAKFVGVDISSGQIARGQARARALGLQNLEFECADVMDYLPSEQSFDLIIAHGLFSWVPEVVRSAILRLCQRILKPRGVAYISYNAMPAWGIRQGVRQALLEAVDRRAPEREQIRSARRALEQFESVDVLAGTAEGALIGQEIAALREKPDAYLLHEYLVEHSRAFWVREFAELAQGYGLQMLTDVAPTGLEGEAELRMKSALSSLSEDSLVREQIADVLGFRQFRAALLCRADAPVEAQAQYHWMEDMYFACPPSETKPTAPVWKSVLMECWPANIGFSELVHRSQLGASELLSELVIAQDIDIRPRQLPICDEIDTKYPRVSELSRFEADNLAFVTNPMHAYAPLDRFHSHVLGLLDGQTARSTLAERLADDVLAGRLAVSRGKLPRRLDLINQLQSPIQQALAGFLAAGILCPNEKSDPSLG